MDLSMQRGEAPVAVPASSIGVAMQDLGHADSETAKKAVKEAQEEARRGRQVTREKRGGRERGERRQSNRGPFKRIPEWQWNKALRSRYNWEVALSRALTNLLRHDHHAEVAAQGFMDTAGWVAVSDVVTIPSIAAWTIDKEEIRAVVLRQSSKKDSSGV